MKKEELKQNLNFSSKDERKELNSPSYLEKNKSGSQNILVFKKFTFEGQSKHDEKHNSSILKRSLKNPFSSNIITNNLLQSIKNKKLSQTSNSKNLGENRSNDIIND